jgi:hypothetical protein
VTKKDENELRDRFAVAALTGLVGMGQSPARMARQAYDIANAMLAQRAQVVPTPEPRKEETPEEEMARLEKVGRALSGRPKKRNHRTAD